MNCAKIMGDIWTSSECMGNLRVLCDTIGSRFAGSDGEREACNFILSKYKEYSIDKCYLEEFEYPSWEREEATLRLIEPCSKKMDVLSLGNSPSTAHDGVVGEVVHLEGASKDFDNYKADIPGKIVLLFSDQPEHRTVRIHRAGMMGAAGVLLVSPFNGMPTVGCAALEGVANVPAASLMKEDGECLKRLLRESPKVKLHLCLRNNVRSRTSWNVIGEILGREKRDEEVIVGAHYDCWDVGPGALDNASGAVVVMEMARVLARAKERLARTVKFICFSAEEIGLHGSKAYVARHEKDLERIILMMNIDPALRMVGYRVQGYANLVSYLGNFVKNIGYPLWAKKFIDCNQDSFPFMLNGVPSVWLQAESRANDGVGHSKVDTMDKISVYDLKEAAIIAAHTLLDFANVDMRPERYLARDEVKRWLETVPELAERL